MTDPDRPHAMLTQDQRAFLRGEKTYDGENAAQQRWQMNDRIRNRVRNTLLDFSLIYEIFDNQEMAKIFDSENGATIDVEEGVIDLLSFLYLCSTPDYKRGRKQAMFHSFNVLLDRAVSHAEMRARGGEEEALGEVFINTEFTVTAADLSAVDIPDIFEKIERGNIDELSGTEMAGFLRYLDLRGVFSETTFPANLSDDPEELRKAVQDAHETDTDEE